MLKHLKEINIAKRKYTEEYEWVNTKTAEEVVMPLQEFAELKSLDFRKLIEIVREDLGCKLHKDWTLVGTDYHNKCIRKSCTVIHTFYNLDTLEQHVLTIDTLMATHPSLKYKGY